MSLNFSAYDQRGYATVDVSRGYAAWASTYENTVPDALDLALLDQVDGVDWTSVEAVLDLACGTGRIGAWLKKQGVRHIIGVDLVDEMLKHAAKREIYDQTLRADIRDTQLESGSFDVVTTVLADEHLPNLEPLYAEVARLLKAGGIFILIGYHPHFQMQFGIPTHFADVDGSQVAIEAYVHLFEEHSLAARKVGFELIQLREKTVDEEFLTAKPKWQRYKGHPVSFMFQWRRAKATDPTG